MFLILARLSSLFLSGWFYFLSTALNLFFIFIFFFTFHFASLQDYSTAKPQCYNTTVLRTYNIKMQYNNNAMLLNYNTGP